jgi:hypothetical protein
MMLSRNRSGEQSVNAAPPSPTRIQDPFPILVGEDIATSEATRISAQRSVETGGSFLTRARGRLGVSASRRLGVSTIIAANVRVIETQSSHSSVQRLTAADNASAASSEHCFFVDGKWECVGDRCRIQKHRVD